MSEPATAEVVVLGAGPAGLAAALRLARAGREVVVIEREPVVGGLAGSFTVAGVRVDHGSHRLHPVAAAEVLAELRSLLGGDLQVRPRNGRIRMAGRFVAFPPRAGDLARRLPLGLGARLARDTLGAPLRRPRADTFAEVVRAGLGPAMGDAFYFPYARKLWGLPPEGLAGELARRRVGARTSIDLLRRLAPRSAPSSTFLYPKGGFGRIPEALADAAVAAGARLQLGVEVVGVAPGPAEVRVGLADGREVRAREVFSTLPLPVLARGGGAPPDVLAAASRLTSRGLVLLYLVLDLPRWTPFDAHYLPEPSVAPVRVSEPKNYRSDSTDPPDRTVLCLELACTPGDATWRAAPAELADQVREELAAQDLAVPDPVAVEVRRAPSVYPVLRVGFADDLRVLEAWASAQPGLLSFGRAGLFTADNTHHVLAEAWAAAGAVAADGRVDRLAWAAAREQFRSHVVED